MFKFFRKNGHDKAKSAPLKLVDIDGTPLEIGDFVLSLRYDLGTCRLLEGEEMGYEYESLSSGQKVSYARMVDAATTYQKVRKIKQPS
ncbi:MAG: hypothetical protein AAF804_01455 [Bacteroidota bacterium]